MNEISHDPSEYIRGLQQLLISDKKRIAFLFGAGTSLARKSEKSMCIPAIEKMTEEIEGELAKKKEYEKAIEEIKGEIGNTKFNTETLLSNLEQKQQIIGNGSLNGLNGDELRKMIKEIKKQIREKVSIHNRICADKESMGHLIHVDFAEWLARADRKYPIEIFTTNYDYLFELGMEFKGVPYYDGFTGSFVPFFNAISIEDPAFLPQQTKLWKIHGSLGWRFDEETKRVIRKDSSEQDILIYPSTLKYSDSKKQPYISLMDRLSSFLKQDDTVLITCGYSFGDEHINERMLTALRANSSSHVIALFYDVFLDGQVRKCAMETNGPLIAMAKENSKLSLYGCRGAIIGCQYGKWKLKTEPDKTDTLNVNLYFDEDAPVMTNEMKVVKKGGEGWTGDGELTLPDFSKFVTFLTSMIIDNVMIKGT
jgi:hypothetical protein